MEEKKFLSADLYLANFQKFSFIHIYTYSTLYEPDKAAFVLLFFIKWAQPVFLNHLLNKIRNCKTKTLRKACMSTTNEKAHTMEFDCVATQK